MTAYTYTVTGTAARGQTWETSGETSDFPPGAFTEAFHDAMRQSFEQLTSGRAVFGFPGLGCSGPYALKKLVIEAKEGI